jgi:NAD(P)-dependent dehydrogenase (short-subunit alcohol dehydrogenase family)
MDDKRRFAGRVALVTGGASGLGRAVASRLASEGAAVAVVDADPEAASETCRQIEEEMAGRALLARADIADAADAERMVAETVHAFGRLDVLFTGAAVGAAGTVVDTSEEEWDRAVGMALKGVYLASKYAIVQMRRAGGGAIVLAASIGGLRGNWGASFCAVKGAVVDLTRSMAVAHAAENIRVNCVCTGHIATGHLPLPIEKQQIGNRKSGIGNAARLPLGRLGQPEEVAAAMAFLASDDASFITGAILPVDGGYLAAGGGGGV